MLTAKFDCRPKKASSHRLNDIIIRLTCAFVTVIFDDDDNDEDASEEREDLFLDTGERKNSKNTESRREREEKLKKMMEDDGAHALV
jgi:hypothetical protein